LEDLWQYKVQQRPELRQVVLHISKASVKRE
jgi:hypothetical protein